MTAVKLLVNGVDRTPPAEWDATWEERVDAVGQASVTVQDRANTPSLSYGRERDLIQFVNPALVGTFDFPHGELYTGEITRSRLDLPPGRPWRRWKVSASDLNTVMDLRLVGVPDGYTWTTIDGGRTHTPLDPNAHAVHTDRTTVQDLFGHYAHKPPAFTSGGGLFQISFFVFNWIPQRVMYDRASGTSHLLWTNATLRSALNEMAGLAAFPIFCWIDPSGYVHWEAFHDPFTAPGGLTTMGPHRHLRAAPAVVTDSGVNGTTRVGGRGLFMEYDATYMPEQAYIGGVTDFIYRGGSTRFQGTGWRRRGTADPTKRQILVDAQAVTEAQRDAVASHYEKFGARARIKGEVTVGRPDEAVDGWRCGQYVTIEDARLPDALNNKAWPILSVKGALKAGNDFQVYTIGFGDAPIETFSQKYRAAPQRLRTARVPAKHHFVKLPTTHLRPSTAYTIYSQMVDHSDKPVRQGGVPVTWALEVRDAAGALVSAGSIVAITSSTDDHGRTAATLTTGAATGLHYRALCTTAAQ